MFNFTVVIITLLLYTEKAGSLAALTECSKDTIVNIGIIFDEVRNGLPSMDCICVWSKVQIRRTPPRYKQLFLKRRRMISITAMKSAANCPSSIE